MLISERACRQNEAFAEKGSRSAFETGLSQAIGSESCGIRATTRPCRGFTGAMSLALWLLLVYIIGNWPSSIYFPATIKYLGLHTILCTCCSHYDPSNDRPNRTRWLSTSQRTHCSRCDIILRLTELSCGGADLYCVYSQ